MSGEDGWCSVRFDGVVAWNRPRLGVNGVYMPLQYVAWKRAACAAVAEARMLRHDGPVELELVIVIQRPLTPALRGGAARAPHVGSPDLDNVLKGVMDVLQESGVVVNDKQVCAENTRRVWGAVAVHTSSYARDARERSCCEVRVRAIGVGHDR
jgi:Holliday junction resolvase RusA-like endonuclease